MKIQDDVMQVLIRSTVDGNKLFLPPTQLDRKLYENVNKVLEGIGGKWNRSSKAHIFADNSSDVLDDIINLGEWTDKKKEYQFFETPTSLAMKMVKLACVDEKDIVLEPSAGKGRIIAEIDTQNEVYAIELNKENYEHLSAHFGSDNTHVILADFLNLEQWYKSPVPAEFDKIIMNPPFSNGQDVKHIFQAWDLLKVGGTLVSIVSESPFFRENKLSQEFRKWIDNNDVEVESLESGTFKESGTLVKTRLIVVKK